MPKSQLFIGFTLACLLSGGLWASSGTEGAAFLDIPVGAGPAAMGSAYSALADDAYAPVWNPAGLGRLQSTQVAAQHLAYLESMNYEFISVVHPFSKGRALGVSAQYLGSGDIAGSDVNGQPTGDYSSHYGAYSLAYGHALNDRLSLGVTGKWIHAQLDDVSADAYAMDLGSIYRMKPNLDIALTLTQIGTGLQFDSESDPLPRALHIAAAYRPLPKWLMSAEGVHSFAGLTSGRLGVEWSPFTMLSIRGGYRTETTKELSAIAGLSMGLGLQVWGHELAYAWLPYGDLGSSQYLSLLLRFGEAETRKRNLIQYQHVEKKTAPGATPAPGAEHEQLIELLQSEDERTTQAPAPTRDPR